MASITFSFSLCANAVTTAKSAQIAAKTNIVKPTVTSTLAKVEPGDNVLAILHSQGFTETQCRSALVSSQLPADFLLAPGDFYRLAKDKNGRIDIRFFARGNPVAYHFWRQGVDSGGDKQNIKFEVKTVSATGHIRGSLIENVAQAIGDELVAYRFMDAFLLDYNLPKVLQRNAAFALTVEKLYEAGQFVRYGEVRHAELQIQGENIKRDFRNLKTGGIFFEPTTDYSSRPFYAPVDYIRISSLFQPHRLHPITHKRRPHMGIDLEINSGEPVFAVAPGEVLRFGKNHAAGRFIVVRHANGYESYYDHMSQVGNFHEGQHVNVGDVVGSVGCSGYCTRPHLHFALKRHGQYINPIHMIRGYSFHQQHEIASLSQ